MNCPAVGWHPRHAPPTNISRRQWPLGWAIASLLLISWCNGWAERFPTVTRRVTRTRLEQIDEKEPPFPVYGVSTRYNNCAVKLVNDGWARCAFPPYNATLDLDVHFSPKPAHTRYAIEPFWVERTYDWGNGLKGRSFWFSSATQPLTVALFEFENNASEMLSLKFDQNGVFRVGHPIGGETVCTYSLEKGPEGDGVNVRARAFPDLFCRLESNFPGQSSLVTLDATKPVAPGEASFLRYLRRGELTFKPRERKVLWLALNGGRTGVGDFPFRPTTRGLRKEFDALQQWQNQRFVEAPCLETPDEELNALFAWSITFPWRTAYDLPLGAPFNENSRSNAVLHVLSPANTISYDYYGIWANDCVETLIEYATLGPKFYPVMANTLDVLYQHGLPESVELPLTNGMVYKNIGDFGQSGEWLNAAATYLLWTGNKHEYARLWPQIRTVLNELDQRDKDGDGLEDSILRGGPKVSFPEQLALGEFNHELLYQNCFWYGGLDAAVKAATAFGNPNEARTWAARRDKLKTAINSRFSTEYGYASWLNKDHRPHPHKGHNQMFALLYGIASPEQAGKVLANQLSTEILSDSGPRVSDMPSKPDAVFETCAWVFTRWGLIQSMYMYGQADRATQLAHDWAVQESSGVCNYQGPEYFLKDGGQPGLGLVWSAGRAVRAFIWGLAGLRLEAEGIRFEPRLPSSWPDFTIKNLHIRGATLDLTVRRGESNSILLDGRPLNQSLISYSMIAKGKHRVIVHCP